MSGLELGRAVRDRVPNVPVIITSAYPADECSGADCCDGAPFEWLVKPFALTELLECIERAIASRTRHAPRRD
jgi:DNA-binding NtrC family response regulator